MIGTSLPELVFIRICIFLLRFTTPICLACLAVLFAVHGPPVLRNPLGLVLIAYSVLDGLYYILIWVPYNRRLQDEAQHPPPLSPEERRALFDKTLDHVPDAERYLRLWFLGADESDIKQENVRDFICWAFFDCAPGSSLAPDDDVMDEYLGILEARLDRKLAPGRGCAQSLRLTLDAVETRYRSFIWYLIIGLVDSFTHLQLAWNGFQYYAQPRSEIFSVIPPRLQSVFARRRSAAEKLGYWYRPHTATDKLPVVFLHGIGIGLVTYVPFLSRLGRSSASEGQVGVIAVEVLPVSFRLTSSPLDKLEFLRQLETILESHGHHNFLLATHSYGSVLATHMIKSQVLGPRIEAMVLTDPVSILLHVPDVAFNFTRRQPHRANEWQLWYFASMDPGVAHALGRHFFWKENIIWKEELLEHPSGHSGNANGSVAHPRRRKVAVCLSGRDLIVDTLTVARYLLQSEDWLPSDSRDAGKNHQVAPDGIEVLWFPGLDHAQAFDTQHNRDRMISVVERYCKI